MRHGMKALSRRVTHHESGLPGSSCARQRRHLSLPLTDDSFINGLEPTRNFGINEAIQVHTYGPKFSLVRFDASTIAGSTVTQATLRVYLRTIAAGDAKGLPTRLVLERRHGDVEPPAAVGGERHCKCRPNDRDGG